jgi:hypothetical protein
MSRLAVAAAIAACAGLSACGPMAAPPPFPVSFRANLDGPTEVPPHAVPGLGAYLATYSPGTHVLSYSISYSGLTGPATMAHLHGPAAPGQNAAVSVPFPPPIMSGMIGTATLTDAQAQMLMAGQMYANVHTAANPGGEIRGQVLQSR